MSLRVATYNAGLAVGVLPNVTERLPHVIAALSRLELDLLFVQEFWIDEHFERLREAVPHLPFWVRPEPSVFVRGTCTRAQLTPLVDCATRNCAALRDEALAQCVVAHCASSAFGLPLECLNCIASNPSGSLDDIVGRCIGAGRASSDPDPAQKRYGGLIAYGGSFGTGLLSRYPLRDTEQITFESSVNARGAVHARIQVPEFGDVWIFAAHLSPGGVEQGPQMARFVAWIQERTRSASAAPAIVLGDLNTQPGSHLYRQLQRVGFEAVGSTNTLTTYFPDGLDGGSAPEACWTLDHVLVRNWPGPTTGTRILDTPITIRIAGAPFSTLLSDHAGLLAELR